MGSRYKWMADWEKKSPPPNPSGRVAPQLCSCLAVWLWESAEGWVCDVHAGNPWALAPEKPWHRCFSAPPVCRKALASRGLGSSLATRK